MAKKENDQYILNHYAKLASQYGDSSSLSIKDSEIREAEVLFFKTEIEDYIKKVEGPVSILDLGCGNGYLLQALEQAFPQAQFSGVEYCEELVRIARKSTSPQVTITHADACDSKSFTESFDIIITERVLVNIHHEQKRQDVFLNISRALKPGGLYLFSESFVETLKNLNKARKESKLRKITPSKHNRFLQEYELRSLKECLQEKEPTLSRHYLSTLFFVKRVLHPLLKPEKSRREGSEIVNFFIQGIRPGVGEYSPIQFRKFQKKL